MSYAEIKKTINGNFKKPLNEKINDYVFSNIWVYTNNATFTVPKNGLYKIIAVGKGGLGIVFYSSINARICYNTGGAGGVATKTVGLTATNTYTITIGTNASISGTNVNMTANGGTNGIDSINQNAAGGSATGGDFNFTGNNGSSNYVGNTSTPLYSNGANTGVYINGLSVTNSIMGNYFAGSIAKFSQVTSGLGIMNLGYSGGLVADYFGENDNVGYVQPSGLAGVIIQLIEEY